MFPLCSSLISSSYRSIDSRSHGSSRCQSGNLPHPACSGRLIAGPCVRPEKLSLQLTNVHGEDWPPPSSPNTHKDKLKQILSQT